MNTLFFALVLITAIFLALLAFSAITRIKFCAICGGVSVGWIILLVMSRLGYVENRVLMAILIGQTIIGVYYLLERRLKGDLLVFRLPFLLSEITVAYTALVADWDKKALWFLAVSWTVFAGIYILRRKNKVKGAFRRILECCKNW